MLEALPPLHLLCSWQVTSVLTQGSCVLPLNTRGQSCLSDYRKESKWKHSERDGREAVAFKGSNKRQRLWLEQEMKKQHCRDSSFNGMLPLSWDLILKSFSKVPYKMWNASVSDTKRSDGSSASRPCTIHVPSAVKAPTLVFTPHLCVFWKPGRQHRGLTRTTPGCAADWSGFITAAPNSPIACPTFYTTYFSSCWSLPPKPHSHSRPIRCRILLEASTHSSWGGGRPECICTWRQEGRLNSRCVGLEKSRGFTVHNSAPKQGCHWALIQELVFSTGKNPCFLLTAVCTCKEDRNTAPSHDAGKQAGQVYKSRRWQTWSTWFCILYTDARHLATAQNPSFPNQWLPRIRYPSEVSKGEYNPPALKTNMQ